MSLQLKCQYLQRTVTRVGTLMGLIVEALREKFFPALFGGEEINADFRKILYHTVKHGGLVILDPRLSVNSEYNTSKADSRELVDSLLGGTALNYIRHRACVCGTSEGARKEKKHDDMVELDIQKEISGGQERKKRHRATSNGSWICWVHHLLNGTELYQEEFRDNLHLRYGLMHQDIPATCDGCGKRFPIEHAIS